jgi:hypothetical protein
LPSTENVELERRLLLTDRSEHDDTHVNESSGEEPESKRPRLDDGYEIALSAVEAPQLYEEAMNSPEATQWKEAVHAEIRSHIHNHTWDIVRWPPGVKVIGHKWVFAIKTDEAGNITRYKARLVALGYLQTFGVDYTSTYSPVASLNTIRVFLAVCCQYQYYIKQYDFETAFLNGDLEETIYMAIPIGIRAENGMVSISSQFVWS